MVTVSPDAGRVALTPHVEVLVDDGGRLDFEGARASEGFEPLGERSASFGFTSATVWLRTSLVLPDTADVGWTIEVGFSQLDHVTVFLRRTGDTGEWIATSTGDRVPFADRPVAHPTFLFPIPDRLGRNVDVYVRVQSSGSLAVPLTLWRSDALFEESNASNLAWGFFYAFLLALALYNLFLYTVVRDRSYLFYVGYLASFVLFQASLTGHGFQYLWSSAPKFANSAAGTFLGVTMCMALLFMRRMANLAEIVPRMYTPVGVIAAGMLLEIPALWIDYSFAALALAFMPFPVVLSYLRGCRPARYLVLGLVVILPGGLMLALRELGVLPAGRFLVDHSIHLGTAAEALILSFALADRIDLLTRAEAEAQARRLDAEQKALVAQRDLSRRLIDAQDAERRRIAGELHDGLGQNMLVIANRLERLEGGEALTELARSTIADLRAVAHGLHPNKLDRLGLTAAIEATVDEACDACGVTGVCHMDAVDGLFSAKAELHLYRIVQEAVANAVRHAGAEEITVVLRRSADTLELRVEDDGRGMSSAATPGLGLAGIGERVAVLHGDLRVTAVLGEGVRIEVDVPIASPVDAPGQAANPESAP